MAIQPYLFFNGRCEEALDFYKEKLGAKVDMLMRFKENPEPPQAARRACRAQRRWRIRSCMPACISATR